MTSAAAKKAWESRRRGRHKGVVHTKINGGRHGKRVAARRENRKCVKHHSGLSSLDKEKWIQGSVKRPGALRALVSSSYGEKGFDNKGRIQTWVLHELTDNSSRRVRRQAQFALNVRGIRR